MQANEPQQATSAVLFVLAAAFIFVCNIVLLRGWSSTKATASDSSDENDMVAGLDNTKFSNKKKIRRTKNHRNMFWPGRRSTSMSPSCGSLSKHLRSRSGSFSGTICAMTASSSNELLTVRPPIKPTADKNWRAACGQWLQWDPNPSTRAVVTGWLSLGDEQTATK